MIPMALILILTVLLIIILFQFEKTFLTGEVIFTPSPAADCSDSSIISVWDSVFQETSTGINIFTNSTVTNGECDSYLAYKIINTNELYLLLGDSSQSQNTNSTVIFGIRESGNNELNSLVQSSANEIVTETGVSSLFYTTIFSTNGTSWRTSAINSIGSANNRYLSVFEVLASNMDEGYWEEDLTYGLNNELYRTYTFENETISTVNNITQIYLLKGFIYRDLSKEIFEHYDSIQTQTNCEPNWIYAYSYCDTDEKEIDQYNDNNCGSTQRIKNVDKDCDYDGNKIIGNLSDLDTANIDLNLKINNSLLNQSKNYSLVQKIEIIEDNTTRVEFMWNFSTPFNLRNISIKKQGSSSSKGYLIVNGIPANKTLRIDKKSNSSSVCVKDKEIISINNISQNCNDIDETIINCPGTNKFSCSISDNYFIVSGLLNSAVKEGGFNASCTSIWNCTAWSECVGNYELRICNDLNACTSNSTKSEEQLCGTSCTPSWTCTTWKPEECPKNKTQTKTCTDSNNCGTLEGRPDVSQSCTDDKKSNWIYILIVVILSGLIALTGYLLYRHLNK